MSTNTKWLVGGLAVIVAFCAVLFWDAYRRSHPRSQVPQQASAPDIDNSTAAQQPPSDPSQPSPAPQGSETDDAPMAFMDQMRWPWDEDQPPAGRREMGPQVYRQPIPAAPPVDETVAPPAPAPVAESAADVFARVSPSICVVRCAGGTGLGFYAEIDGRHYVVTCYHVVAGAAKLADITFEFGRGKASPEEIAFDERADFAACRVTPIAGLAPIPLSRARPAVGDTVLVAGPPEAPGEGAARNSPKAGVVRSVFARYLETDAPVHPANGGGPVLNAGGEVVGIARMNSVTVPDDVAIPAKEGMAYALLIERVQKALEQDETGDFAAHLERRRRDAEEARRLEATRREAEERARAAQAKAEKMQMLEQRLAGIEDAIERVTAKRDLLKKDLDALQDQYQAERGLIEEQHGEEVDFAERQRREALRQGRSEAEANAVYTRYRSIADLNYARGRGQLDMRYKRLADEIKAPLNEANAALPKLQAERKSTLKALGRWYVY